MKASLIAIVFALYFCPSCEDSNLESDTSHSSIFIENEFFPICKAGLLNYGPNPDKSVYEGFMNVLLFVTEGIDFAEQISGELELKGAGALMGIVFFSKNETSLAPRDYFINLRPPYKVNDIGIGFYSLDFNEENVVGPYFEYNGVALLFRKSKFMLETVKKYSLYLIDPKTQHRRTTRDQLVLSGFWEGSKLVIAVNHWPSRRGGQKRSQASRLKAAQLQQRILDSIQLINPEAYLISMGDFNDNPNNKSVALLTQKSDYRPHFRPLENPMKKLFQNGIGSLAYRDRWYLFDQILISKNWRSKENLIFFKAAVFNPSFLRTPEGKFRGYPYRNKVIGAKLNGYADHFPVYILIGKKN